MHDLGLRRSEVIALDVGDVDLATGTHAVAGARAKAPRPDSPSAGHVARMPGDHRPGGSILAVGQQERRWAADRCSRVPNGRPPWRGGSESLSILRRGDRNGQAPPGRRRWWPRRQLATRPHVPDGSYPSPPPRPFPAARRCQSSSASHTRTATPSSAGQRLTISANETHAQQPLPLTAPPGLTGRPAHGDRQQDKEADASGKQRGPEQLSPLGSGVLGLKTLSDLLQQAPHGVR
jgi:hypothetical protein